MPPPSGLAPRVHVALVGDGLQSAVEGETARFEVLLTVASQDAAADGTGAVGHTSSLAHAAGMMRCRYEGADAGEAVLTGSSTDNSRLQYQFIPRLPGCIRILAEGPMPQTIQTVAERVSVFPMAPWTFHQLGVVSMADPLAPIPPGFYDVVVATPMCIQTRRSIVL